MNVLFKKLNYKDQPGIVVINAPENFSRHVVEMSASTVVHHRLASLKRVDFFLAFVIKQKDVDDLIAKLNLVAMGDCVVWFAYPKKTSKKFTCEFNRDTGWAKLGSLGYEPVRMVAIDEDWSALRFRKAENIKKMTRSLALSEAGKRKIAAVKGKT